MREGFLTPAQLLASLGRQLRLQRRIGEYFVERGLLDEATLEDALRRLVRHNVRHYSDTSNGRGVVSGPSAGSAGR